VDRSSDRATTLRGKLAAGRLFTPDLTSLFGGWCSDSCPQCPFSENPEDGITREEIITRPTFRKPKRLPVSQASVPQTSASATLLSISTAAEEHLHVQRGEYIRFPTDLASHASSIGLKSPEDLLSPASPQCFANNIQSWALCSKIYLARFNIPSHAT
jgi:hypothetical protein